MWGMNWNKILKILSIIIILSAIGYGLYYFFRTNPTAKKIIGNVFRGTLKTGEETGAKGTISKNLSALTEETIFDYWVNAKNGSLYYLNPAGQV